MSQTQVNGTLLGNGTISVFYTGTDDLVAGYGLCYDYSQTTVADRSKMVAKPSYLNSVTNPGFAGVVARDFDYSSARSQSYNGVDGSWIDIVPVHGHNPLRPVQLFTDISVTLGDMIGVRPGSYIFGKAVATQPIGRALETVDRSATSGLVHVEFGRFRWDDYPIKLNRHFDHFRTPNVPGVVAGALASHAYHLAGTTAMAIAPLAAAAETVINITEGVGELALLGTTTTIAQMSMIGGQYLLAAGQEIFVRQRVKIDNIADEDWFWGLGTPPTQSGGVLTTVAQVTSGGTAPAATDYAGFFFDGSANAGVPNINIRKASGTEQTAALTGALLANNTYIELAMLLRNRVAGAAAGAKTVYAWANGTLVASLESATHAAAFPDTVPVAWSMAGITGACCCTIDYLEMNHHR